MLQFLVVASALLSAVIGTTVDDEYDYYSGIDSSAVNDDLKGQLKALINPHTVYTYDDVWLAFPQIDIYLPGYPCNANLSYIPDVYSSYCWEPDNLTSSGGECGNYKQEGDCYNREHLW
jgi:hypothetical protein